MRMDEHWSRARLDAEVVNDSTIQVKTDNVNAFTLKFGPAGAPFELDAKPAVMINAQKVTAPGPEYRWLLDGFVSQSRGQVDDRSARSPASARSTDCRGRSTMRSWTASSS